VVTEEARRIGQHIVPIAAVADFALVVLVGGLSANGDLLRSTTSSRTAGSPAPRPAGSR
jgi:predicted NBD/HSP70 family sugar kinase